MSYRKIHPRVYRIFAGPTSNQYLIVEPQDLTLIDAGMPGSQRVILAAVQKLGYLRQDLSRILITHADADHYGAAQALRAATGAVILASAVTAAAMAQGGISRPLGQRTLMGKLLNQVQKWTVLPATPVDGILEEGTRIPVLGGLRVIETPGHCPGHVSFYAEREGILFAGDSLRIAPGHISFYRNDTTWDEQEAGHSLQLQMNLHPRIICGGHGFTDRVEG